MSFAEHRLALARMADAPVIAALSRGLVEAGLTPSWPADRVARHICNADSVVLTAKRREALSGFAIMQFGEATAHLNLLAVDSGYQRRGLGRALLTWLEQSAVVAGTFLIELELRASNAGARAFYEQLGYRETGRVPGYYQRLEDAIRMARDLRVSEAAPGRA
ncbi:MAG TPA: GNAT family N-acetyltransferase [Steroidobacteraceae bacterium]|nr:GNAT family N-acetyltransferase [Steroidobacteraceae bacterium]